MANHLPGRHTEAMQSIQIKRHQCKYESQMECMLCDRQFFEKYGYIRFASEPILLAGKNTGFRCINI